MWPILDEGNSLELMRCSRDQARQFSSGGSLIKAYATISHDQRLHFILFPRQVQSETHPSSVITTITCWPDMKTAQWRHSIPWFRRKLCLTLLSALHTVTWSFGPLLLVAILVYMERNRPRTEWGRWGTQQRTDRVKVSQAICGSHRGWLTALHHACSLMIPCACVCDGLRVCVCVYVPPCHHLMHAETP